MNRYLRNTPIIDWQHPLVLKLSEQLWSGCSTKNEYIKRAFEYVRDAIQHSWDFRRNPVTCAASTVLEHETGYCYAKSHLLAALLRAREIPAGFCYQRLSLEGHGPPYSLHGLNAVYLDQYGWYRIDARGNKEGVNAQFTPPVECLAFAVREEQERDLPEIWADPLPVVVEALQEYSDVTALHGNLPDIDLFAY